jgi:monoamine oxidase
LGDFFREKGYNQQQLDVADILFAQTCCAHIDKMSVMDQQKEMKVDHAGEQEFRIVEGYSSLMNKWSRFQFLIKHSLT